MLLLDRGLRLSYGVEGRKTASMSAVIDCLDINYDEEVTQAASC